LAENSKKIYKMSELIQIIKRNKSILITIGVVALLTIILINQAMGIMFKAQLLQDPCSLCESYIHMKDIPININIFNLSN
jgi:hypothetical protein